MQSKKHTILIKTTQNVQKATLSWKLKPGYKYDMS
jgi:hypothetical protein